MNILVTGAHGQLGRALRRSLKESGLDYICTARSAFEDLCALDVADEDQVERFFGANKIDVVVNCAAYTDVNAAEDDEDNALCINAKAPAILASAAARHGASMIHISTDYVFDGKSDRPYVETDEVSPLNAYGRTKLAGEKAVAESGCSYVILRTSWLYSCTGRNFFNTIVERTAEMSSMKVVVDQVGTPTYAGDLADAIVHIIGCGIKGKEGVYHYSDEGVASWYDLAVEICSGVGHICDIQPCRTEDFPTKAVRPHYSVLDKSKIKQAFGLHIPHWRESLKVCCVADYNKEI